MVPHGLLNCFMTAACRSLDGSVLGQYFAPLRCRHSVLYQLCQAVVKDIFAPTFAGYSSNTTVSRAGSRHLSLPARALMLMLPGIRGMQYQHRRW